MVKTEHRNSSKSELRYRMEYIRQNRMVCTYWDPRDLMFIKMRHSVKSYFVWNNFTFSVAATATATTHFVWTKQIGSDKYRSNIGSLWQTNNEHEQKPFYPFIFEPKKASTDTAFLCRENKRRRRRRWK